MPVIANQPLARRRSRRSLSKYRHHRLSVASSHHGHGSGGGIPTSASHPHAPFASLSQLNLSSSSSSFSSSTPPPPLQSPIYLHLPRTFRGPLTIHISSGHISERLRISEGLEREMALIRESEFSRGYFVGGLGRDDDNNMDKRKVYDGGEEEEDGYVDLGAGGGGGAAGREQIEKTKKKKRQLGNNNNNNSNKNMANSVDESELSSTSSVSSSSSSSTSSSPGTSPALKGGGIQGEWYGDRIEILVGSGDVYLQFEDENNEHDDEHDPFSRARGLKKREVGFWKRFFLL